MIRCISHPVRFTVLIVIVELLMISSFILVGINHGDTHRLFGEKGLATWVSFFQLLLLSAMSLAILFLRYHTTGKLLRHLFWALAAAGFLVLALDEKLMWHERFDFFLHRKLAIRETAITDRIDDVIIGFYGLIGLLAIYLWRREIGRFPLVNRLLALGFILVFSMVFLDILGNRYDIIPAIFADELIARQLFSWGSVLEESIKLFVGGVFIAALYSYWYYSRPPPVDPDY